MMANWDLTRLVDDMSALAVPLLLVIADGDKAVPAADAHLVAAKIPGAEVLQWSGVGHVGHEEDPQEAISIIRTAWKDWNRS